MLFENKVVLVTGASGVIGKAICKAYIAEGATVVAYGRNTDQLEELKEAASCRGSKVYVHYLDVTSEESIQLAFAYAVEKTGKIDVLVNCAGGGARERSMPLANQDTGIIKEMIEVNLLGTILCTKCALNYMKAGSAIVNISSILGENGLSNYSEYAAAKGGVHAFTKSLAKELGPVRIRVNSVSPGVIPRLEEEEKAAKKNSVLNICGTGEDVANAVLFISSEQARYMTGIDIPVDGGRRLALVGTPEPFIKRDDYTFSNIVSQQRYIVYGTGVWAGKLTDVIEERQSQVVAYIDSNKEKQGNIFQGKRVYSPVELLSLEGYDKIIIGCTYEDEIRKILEALGVNQELVLDMK